MGYQSPQGSPEVGGGLLERSWAFWALVGGASLLGAFLRLHGLEQPSLWVDEFFTIGRAGVDPLHWTYALGYQPTRLSLWLAGADLSRVGLENVADWPALGVSERAARLGACWVGIASVPILALLARPVAGAGVAGASALLLAIVPYHIYWSQMARYYTSEFLLANAFLLLFARGMQSGRAIHFSLAGVAALLAFLSHFTAVFVVGACIAVVGLAWIARAPVAHLASGAKTLALITAVCVLTLLSKELGATQAGSLDSFSTQTWAPSLATLAFGTVLRFEPVICAVGFVWLVVAVRRRDPFAILVGAVALLAPVTVLMLKAFFPVGQRYYFACLYAWLLLAAMWAVEMDRRATASGGGIIGAAALGVLLVAVGFNSWLYERDGAGARTRWRDAYAYVRDHGGSDTPVYVNGGKFQARYYLGRVAHRFPREGEVATLPPGAFVISRTRGSQATPYGERLDVKARFEIPSKPWSWVLNVMRVPGP